MGHDRCRRAHAPPLLLLGLCLVAGSQGCGGAAGPPDGGLADGDGGSCPLVCVTADECCDGLQCVDGVCTSLETPCPTGCNFECDAPHRYTCNRTTLRCEDVPPPATCQGDCDCYAGEACVAGACSPRCQGDDECPAGQVCGDHVCQAAVCQTRADCVGHGCQVCKGGRCAAPAAVCLTDEDCCLGFHCNFSECAPDVEGCQADSDCPDPAAPACVDHKCVPREAACALDADCPLPGQVCQDGRCVTPGCSLESCPLGQWCDVVTGLCKPGCDSNADCVAPAICDYGSHQCGQADCCGGRCAAGAQVCDPATCQCVNVCRADADCPAGFACRLADGRCVCTAAGCPAGSHCDALSGACVVDAVGCDPATELSAPIACGGAPSSSFEQGCLSTQRAGSFARQFVLQGVAGQVLTAELASSVDTYLYLFGPNGALLASNDDGPSANTSRIVHALAASGAHTLEATTYASGVSADFVLTLACADPGDCTAPLTCGESAAGSFAPGCVSPRRAGAYARLYTFEGAGGERVTISLASAQADAYLYLIGPNGAVLDQDDDGGSGTDAFISHTLSADGTYTIEATTLSAADPGTFSLSLTCGQASDCSGPIACGQTLQGIFSPACEAPDRYGSYGQVYLLDVSADTDLTIDLVSDAADAFLMLFDPDGYLADYDDDSGSGSDARIRGTVLVGGTWFVEATTYDYAETGAYTLSVTCR